MCCCCFCCFKVKGAGKEGTRYCLCWFLLSMPTSILAIAFATAIFILLGGPIPTHHWSAGMIILIVENALAIIIGIVCIIVIVRFIRNKIFGLAVLVCMVIIFILSLAAGISMAHFPGADEMSPYVRDYYKNHDLSKAPPALDILQSLTSNFRKGLNCCGGKGYHDYADQTKRTDQTTGKTVFTVPDSCCSKETFKDGCGKNLDWEAHENLHVVGNMYIGNLGKAQEFVDEVEKLVDGGDLNEQKLRKLMDDYKIYTKPEDADDAIKQFKEFKNHQDTVKIGVLGCGAFLDVVYNNPESLPPVFAIFKHVKTGFQVFIGLIVVKILIVCSTVVVYTYYYMRWNFPKPVAPIAPLQQNVAEDVPPPPPPEENEKSQGQDGQSVDATTPAPSQVSHA